MRLHVKKWTRLVSITETPTSLEPQARSGLFAAGGLIGAILASTCCVLPLLLVSLGISGAWIGQLTALSPYQPYFLVSALALLGAGFWQAYRRKPEVCAPGSICAKPTSGRLTKSILWIGTMFVAADFMLLMV